MSDASQKPNFAVLPGDPVVSDLFNNYMKFQNLTAHKREYAGGETCWFHADDYDDAGEPVLTSGTVVGYLTMDGVPDVQYLIRPDAPYYTHLEVRDWRLMSADKNTFPAVWPPVVRRRMPKVIGTN